MALWVELPAGVSAYGTAYYWDVISGETSREKPCAPVDWVAELHPSDSSKYYYWHRTSRKTLSDPPTADTRPETPRVCPPQTGPNSTGCGTSPPAAAAAEGWVFQTFHSFELPAPTCDGEADDGLWPNGGGPADVGSTAWVEVDRQNGGRPYFWNYRLQVCLNELPAGARCRYHAVWNVEISDYYYHDRQAGISAWESPLQSVVDAAEVPSWLERGVAVTVDGLVKDRIYNGHSGHFIGADSSGAALVALPDSMGGVVLALKLRCLRPLAKGSLVELSNLRTAKELNGKVGTIESFDQEQLPARYCVNLAVGLTKSISATKVSPRSKLWDLCVADAPRWLQWRSSEKEHIFIDSEGQHRKCHLHLPLDYADKSRELSLRRQPKWPLLVYLHGAGGGSFFTSSKKALKSQGQQYAARKFVVLSPVCDWKWTEVPRGWVNELVAELCAAPFIDSRRIYLTGCSMGGMGTWELAAKSPELFAAVAPVAAHHQEERRSQIIRQLQNMPIFVVHSRFDETCPLRAEQSLWTGLLQGNPRLQVNMTEQVDHCSMFERAFCDSTQLYDWLLLFRRAAPV